MLLDWLAMGVWGDGEEEEEDDDDDGTDGDDDDGDEEDRASDASSCGSGYAKKEHNVSPLDRIHPEIEPSQDPETQFEKYVEGQ